MKVSLVPIVAERRPDPSDLLNMDEVAYLLRARVGTVRRLYANGAGPLRFRMVGRVLVISRGEVESWLDETTIAHTARLRADQPPALPQRYTLYRFYDEAGSLLYVGITTTGASRWTQHSKGQRWWPEVATIKVEHLGSVDELRESEIAAIRSERPRYNVVHLPR